MKKVTTTLVASALLAGCASGPTGANYRPLVDTRGSTSQNYEADLVDCQGYATQRAGAGQRAVAGAVAGALLGVALAAIGGAKGFRNELAGIGALTGGLQGAGQGEGTQRDIIRRCLANRGYSVLD